MMSLGIAASGLLGQTFAENVDSELLLLVDVTQNGKNDSDIDDLMAGYAEAFSSSQVLNSIQSGSYGRIAVSLMFFGDSPNQVVGIPWMSIGSAAEASGFSALVQSISRPGWNKKPDVGAAITAGSLTFGTETGSSANGFESAVQIIEVAGARKPGDQDVVADAAGDAALVSGVDLINSITLGKDAGKIEAFYVSNIIGSSIPNVVATSTNATTFPSLDGLLADQLASTVQTGADVSVAAVPEPAPVLSLMSGMALMLLVRRR